MNRRGFFRQLAGAALSPLAAALPAPVAVVGLPLKGAPYPIIHSDFFEAVNVAFDYKAKLVREWNDVSSRRRRLVVVGRNL